MGIVAPPKMSLNTTGLYGIVRHPGMSFFIGVAILYNSHNGNTVLNCVVVIFLYRL